MVKIIAAREIRTLFYSPVAWSMLAIVEALLAWLFLTQLEQYIDIQPQLIAKEIVGGVTELVVAPFIESAALIFILITPLLTMRSISEEFRSGTYNLLYSAPVPLRSVVLGKYLAILSLFAVAFILIMLMPLSLALGVQLDYYRFAAGALGLALLIISATAIGLFISSLTDQPAVAALGTYGLLLFLWVINISDLSGEVVWLDWLSLASHFRRMLTGLVNSADLIYYLIMTITFLGLTIYRLDSRRNQY